MIDDPGVLQELQTWYLAQCDEDWEHDYGISIGTLDNPGWLITIDLAETLLELKPFTRIELNRSETDWIHCWVEEKKFQAAGGAHNLPEILRTFLNWAQTEPDWLARPECSAEEMEAMKELAFWESLGPVIEKEACGDWKCKDSRIQYSIFCRAHHFQQMTGKLPNFA